MTVFTLKKYQDPQTQPVEQTQQESQDQKKEQGQFIVIQANNSVSQMVASALYKAMPNVKEDEVDPNQEVDTHVISTEDINAAPVDTWNKVKNTKEVVIVNRGFSTRAEEWFLGSLEQRGIKTFYSMESYLRHVGKNSPAQEG